MAEAAGEVEALDFQEEESDIPAVVVAGTRVVAVAIPEEGVAVVIPADKMAADRMAALRKPVP